ncbi:MAG: ketol-acid reductoisomerase [Candidatus Eisenbacteria bacterium]|nr:ketol-acid reductoisomerase [Candidatus Eisenbacteria bacterium]
MSSDAGPRRVAVIGFGHQGEAQALNLRDSGWNVVVGAREGRDAESRSRAHGFETLPPPAAAALAESVALLLPDEALRQAWPAIRSSLREGVTLVFAHGFNLVYGDLGFPRDADVVLVSPSGPGRVLREVAAAGGRLPAYVAAHHDASGRALERAEAYAHAAGCGPLWRTTVRDETEVDLFGEQAVLCGGMNALVTAAFETLVEAGYAPELAYLECVHQLRYLAELLHERGVAGLRRSISGTALYGDLTRGPRVIGGASRKAMREVLEEIRSGAFAREWMAEAAQGRPRLAALQFEAEIHAIEEARRGALGPPRNQVRGGEPGHGSGPTRA